MHATNVSLLWVDKRRMRFASHELLTSIQQIQGIIQVVVVGQFGVTTKDDEGVAHQKARVSNARPGAISCSRYWVASHASVAHLCQPQVALDSSTANETSHEVDRAIFRGGRVDGSAVPGEGVACGEVQTARGPRVGRVWRIARVSCGL